MSLKKSAPPHLSFLLITVFFADFSPRNCMQRRLLNPPPRSLQQQPGEIRPKFHVSCVCLEKICIYKCIYININIGSRYKYRF